MTNITIRYNFVWYITCLMCCEVDVFLSTFGQTYDLEVVPAILYFNHISGWGNWPLPRGISTKLNILTCLHALTEPALICVAKDNLIWKIMAIGAIMVYCCLPRYPSAGNIVAAGLLSLDVLVTSKFQIVTRHQSKAKLITNSPDWGLYTYNLRWTLTDGSILHSRACIN